MSTFDAYYRLEGKLEGSLRTDEPMSRHTTFRIGGNAALFVECTNTSDLSLVLSTLEEAEMSWTVIGKGSNFLVSDAGYDGAIIMLGTGFREYSFNEEGNLVVGGGTVLARVVQEAFNKALSGFEFAVGIPGTVGGALAMNAGTRTEWIGAIVQSVTTCRPREGLKRYRGDAVEWGYRCTSLPAGEVIVEAELSLSHGEPMLLHAKMESSLKRRRASQPLSQPSAGSVFRNPADRSVGELIEECGLKGAKYGAAQVSTVHANFIVNTGGATADDVLNLIITIRERVKEVHGIELQPEIRFLGFPIA
jgi:UDP-N-acetylmuramate dehydrogenase